MLLYDPMSSALFLTLATLTFGPPSEGPPKPHVQARLLSEVESIQPGRAFVLGLHLTMEPGWHTYWVNPGDSGLPTRMAWRIPEGVKVAPLEWPTPGSFGSGPLVSYGYAGQVLLLARVTPPASLRDGQSLTLAGRASWLECREICIPGRADLSLTLPVAAGLPRPSAEARRFAEARARLPRPAADWRITAAIDGPRLTLALSPPARAVFPAAAAFFAELAGLVEHGEPQRLSRAPRGARLEIPLSANRVPLPDRLRGVLLIPGGRGQETSIAVDVPLSSLHPSAKGDRP